MTSAVDVDPSALAASDALAECDSRRCALCGERFPAFGYGPPLTREPMLWACSAHRAELERRLCLKQRGEPATPDPSHPLLL